MAAVMYSGSIVRFLKNSNGIHMTHDCSDAISVGTYIEAQ